MALTVTHSFVSAIADGADATLVRPSNWNASHILAGILDVSSGGTGAASFTAGAYLKGNAAAVFTVQTTPIPVADGGTGVATIPSGAYVKGAAAAAITTQATPIPVTDGGTGAVTLASGAYLKGSGTNALTTQAVPIPIADGGLAVTTVPAQGAIPIGTGSAYTVTPIIAGSNITITNGIGAITIAATAGSGVETWCHLGQISRNGTSFPNTQWVMTATNVVLRNTSDAVVVRNGPALVTNTVTTAGSVADGRDQVGAFTASSWVHFYWIWDGATLSSLSSVVAPPTGPTLPAGYTHWAYAGAVRFNASSQLLGTRINGDTGYFTTQQSALVNGTATSETAVALAAMVPPNALAALINGIQVSGTAASADYTAELRVATGVTYYAFDAQATAASDATRETADVEVPVSATTSSSTVISYIQLTAASTGLSLRVTGYHLPNGGA